MSYDNSPLLVERNERGFWCRTEHIDQAKTVLDLWQALFHSSVAVDHTGTVAETTLRTVTIPGGMLGPDGVLRVSALWSYTGSVNAKTLRMRLAGTQLAIVDNNATAANISGQAMWLVTNRGSEAAQIANPGYSSGLIAATATSIPTATVDTSVDQVLTITGQLASAGELLRLERLLIEVLPS